MGTDDGHRFLHTGNSCWGQQEGQGWEAGSHVARGGEGRGPKAQVRDTLTCQKSFRRGEQRLASCLCKRVTGQTGQEPLQLTLQSLTCATCIQLQGKYLGKRFTCLQLLCYSCAGYLGLFTVVIRSAFRDKGSHSLSVCVTPPKRSGSPNAAVCMTAL